MFLRRPKLPADQRPPLDREERVTAWASTSDGCPVVVTNLGLWLPNKGERLGWHEIHKVAWDPPVLTVVPGRKVGDGDGYDLTADAPPVALAIDSPGEVPHQIRTRVTQSVIFTEHYTTPVGGARVVGRKVPGADGLSWQVRPDDGTDLTDPEAAAALAGLITQLAQGR